MCPKTLFLTLSTEVNYSVLIECHTTSHLVMSCKLLAIMGLGVQIEKLATPSRISVIFKTLETGAFRRWILCEDCMLYGVTV